VANFAKRSWLTFLQDQIDENTEAVTSEKLRPIYALKPLKIECLW